MLNLRFIRADQGPLYVRQIIDAKKPYQHMPVSKSKLLEAVPEIKDSLRKYFKYVGPHIENMHLKRSVELTIELFKSEFTNESLQETFVRFLKQLVTDYRMKIIERNLGAKTRNGITYLDTEGKKEKDQDSLEIKGSDSAANQSEVYAPVNKPAKYHAHPPKKPASTNPALGDKARQDYRQNEVPAPNEEKPSRRVDISG